MLAFSIWAILLIVLGVNKIRYHGVNKKWGAISSDISRIKELKQQNKELSSKLEVLKNVGGQKFSWSSVLKRINAILPQELWLTSIEVERRMEKDDVRDSAGAPFARNKVLAIRGLAVSLKGEEAVGSIGKFLSMLKEDEVFSRNFINISMGNISKTRIGNIDVMKFELFCSLE